MGKSTESELNSSFSKTNCFIKYLQEVVWGFCLDLYFDPCKRCSPLTASSPSCVTEEIQHGQYWQSQSWLDITTMSLREVWPQAGQDQKLGFKDRRPVSESCLKCRAVGNAGEGPSLASRRLKTEAVPGGLPQVLVEPQAAASRPRRLHEDCQWENLLS